MPARLRTVILVLFVIGVVCAGFFVGKSVSAAGSDPGSQSDPLVAKSYVDGQISGILARLSSLETAVAQLQQAHGIQPQPTSSTTSVTPPAPTTPTSSNPPTVSSSAVKSGVVSGTYVNFRTGAGTSYSVITGLHKGDTAQVLGSQSGWYQIKLPNGTEGWVAGWLFTVQ
ncbi:MAG: SH3 domain-containing protein [Peptococcaceae bacterium]|nr:SH3 domain-containing protein [Peptococcaceae bacterium]